MYHIVRSVVVGDRKLRARHRSRVQEFGKNHKEAIDSAWLGAQITCRPRWNLGPRTSQCFRCGKRGHSGKSFLLFPGGRREKVLRRL